MLASLESCLRADGVRVEIGPDVAQAVPKPQIWSNHPKPCRTATKANHAPNLVELVKFGRNLSRWVEPPECGRNRLNMAEAGRNLAETRPDAAPPRKWPKPCQV